MTTTATIEISNTDNIIDVRDSIARVEELESALPPSDEADGSDNEERAELAVLVALLDDLRGNGGDHEWKDAWYPVILIRDSYFEDYAREEAEELGLITGDTRWPATCIDWEKAASELQYDYTETDFDGTNYWYR